MKKKSRIVEAPNRPGYIIECKGGKQRVGCLIEVNQVMSQHRLNNEECIVRDEEDGEVVAEIHIVDGKLKWDVYRHIPSFDEMFKELNRLRKELVKIIGDEQENPSQMQRYQEIEDREKNAWRKTNDTQ